VDCDGAVNDKDVARKEYIVIKRIAAMRSVERTSMCSGDVISRKIFACIEFLEHDNEQVLRQYWYSIFSC